MGAAAGAQGGRDGTGEEAGRAWERLVERLVEPLLRLLVLTLGTRAMAAGRRETVGLSTAWAGRKAVVVGTGATCADGLPGLEVGRRQGGERARDSALEVVKMEGSVVMRAPLA
jgi:hypothetical protein